MDVVQALLTGVYGFLILLGFAGAGTVALEQRIPYGAWDGGSLCRWHGSDQVFEDYLCNDELFSEDNYGEVWRCWTYQPTREQMEAEPWQS